VSVEKSVGSSALTIKLSLGFFAVERVEHAGDRLRALRSCAACRLQRPLFGLKPRTRKTPPQAAAGLSGSAGKKA